MRDRDKRRQDAAEKSQAARSITENEMIRAFFEDIRENRIQQMIDAKAGDDETRRISAIEIQVIDGLWRSIETEAAKNRNPETKQKRTNANE